MAPVRVVRAFRFSVTVIITALALSGCMRTAGPVAVAPQSYLDAMTFGQPYASAPGGGGAPRARRDRVTVTHTDVAGTGRYVVPPGTSLSPGDTVLVGERWF